MATKESRVEKVHALLVKLISNFPDLSHQSIPLRRKLRDLSSGDFVLPKFTNWDSSKKQELLQFVQNTLNESDIPIAKVLRDEHNLLTFFLERHQIIKDIVSEIHSQGSQYGISKVGKGHKVFLNRVSNQHENSLSDYRLSTVASHAANLLTANGYDVHLLHENAKNEGLNASQSVVNEKKQSASTSTTGCHNHQCSCRFKFVSKARKLLDDQDKQKTPEPHLLCVDRIIRERKLLIGKDGINKNLQQIEILNSDDEPSEILKEVISLEDKLDHKMGKKNEVYTCMHITLNQKAFRQQQILLLKLALSDKDDLQSQLVVGPVISKQESSWDDFYRRRHDQMKEASEMRYGQKCEGSNWETRLNLLTKAGLTFDFHGTACHRPLCLDLESSSPAESRMGAFVLYNTARLASLFHHFAQEVEKGTYPPLPAVESVDFTLLREEEDWELAFLYIASFPGIIKDSVEVVSCRHGAVLAKIHTHKVVNFLTTFSKSLSSYYSRYHILGGGEPHLLPLMYARLYLMRAAHQVLVSSLQLLDIPALDQL